jgi:hypothetical protein
VLYVSAISPHSTTALRNLRRALASFASHRIRLTVHDLSKDPQRAERDGVHFTPALVTTGHRPRTWIVGHLGNPQVLQALLESALEPQSKLAFCLRFPIHHHRSTLRRVCVFCGSSTGHRDVYAHVAGELGREMARRGIGLVFGGGAVGLMGVVADAVLAAGGHAVGVIPHALVARELAHRALPDLRVVNSMHERKATMAQLSDAFIAMPADSVRSRSSARW